MQFGFRCVDKCPDGFSNYNLETALATLTSPTAKSLKLKTPHLSLTLEYYTRTRKSSRGYCLPCASNCSECTGPNSEDCTLCIKDMFMFEGKCTQPSQLEDTISSLTTAAAEMGLISAGTVAAVQLFASANPAAV
jgi:hypothetical protein